MTLGSTFINVFGGRDSRSDDAVLREALDELITSPRPCTLWISRIAALTAVHSLPASSTLAFAPRAFLVVTGGGSLTVLGRLDAGLEARFFVQRGSVHLHGPLDEIVADWWLASGGRNPVEFALDACWDRARRPGLSPCPVRLTGPYALSRTLRVAPPSDLTGRINLAFRGQHTRPSDPPTFTVTNGDGGLSSLMSVEGGAVVALESVAFDATRSPTTACLSLEGRFHRSRIESCKFAFAGWGIRVRPNEQRWIETHGGVPDARQAVEESVQEDAIALSTSDANRLEVSRCLFVGAASGSNVPGAGCGIDVGLSAPTILSLRDSQFVGVFAQAIRMLGGELDVTACQFANEIAQVVPPDRVGATADILVLRWTGLALLPPFEFVPKDWPVWRPLGPGGGDLSKDLALANTHLTVTHCVSTSPTFLVLYPAFDLPNTLPAGATLTNVRHDARGSPPTSVYVARGAGSRSLMLQGCWFGGAVSVAPNPLSDVVVDLGSRFDGPGVSDAEPGVGPPQQVITLRTPPR